MCSTIRKAGIKKLLTGGVGIVAESAFFYFLSQQGFVPNSIALMTFAFPGAYFLMGLMKVISNVPFSDIGQKWDELKGW